MIKIQYIRTSTLKITIGRRTILTDPWFGNFMRGLPCLRKFPLAPEALGRVDMVLISHLHPDHFDMKALSAIWNEGLIICGPAGISRKLAGVRGGKIVEMRPLDEHDAQWVKIHATRAEHTFPSPEEINFVIAAGQRCIFFGGDTRFSGAFSEIRSRFDVEVALVPVSGTRVFGKRVVMSPDEAVTACEALGVKTAIPIHQGGDWLSVPPFSFHPGTFVKFAEEAARRGSNFMVKVLESCEEHEI